MTEKKRIPINVPDIGSTTDEIRFVSWLVTLNATVEKDEDLYEVETDKAVFVAGSEFNGVIASQDISQQGTIISTGQTIGWLEIVE